MNLKSILRDVAVVAVLLAPGMPSAEAGVYSTSGFDTYKIGDNLGTQYDQLLLAPLLPATLSGPGIYLLNTLSFNVAINSCCIYDPVIGAPISETLTVNGVSKTLDIYYSVHIDYLDTLKIVSGGPLSFAGYTFTLIPQVLGPQGVGSLSGALYADVSIAVAENAPAAPEPSTWAMMILGFAGVGFMAYRRKNGTVFRIT